MGCFRIRSVSIKIIKMFLLSVFVLIMFSVFRPRASSVPTVRITKQSKYSTVSQPGHTRNWPGKIGLSGPTPGLLTRSSLCKRGQVRDWKMRPGESEISLQDLRKHIFKIKREISSLNTSHENFKIQIEDSNIKILQHFNTSSWRYVFLFIYVIFR